MVRKIVRLVKNNPRTTGKYLQGYLADEGADVNLNAVSNILHEAEIHCRRPRKTPQLRDVHLRARLKYAREHGDKDNIF